PVMWSSIAFLAVMTLSPAQSGQLTLTNVRSTYGILGPTRADNKVLPGDTVVLSFDMEGAKVDANGKVLYSIGMEVDDSNGKVLYKQAPQDREALLPAGSKALPAAANMTVGLDQKPGEYTLK